MISDATKSETKFLDTHKILRHLWSLSTMNELRNGPKCAYCKVVTILPSTGYRFTFYNS